MKKTHRALLGVVLAGALFVAACSSGNERSEPNAAPSQPAVSAATIDPIAFRGDMRKLWEDHVQWTRLYIVSAVADLPDADATLQRLLQNQTDIGDAVAPFYGEAAGAQLTTLLNGHIAIAGELVGAAKASDEAAVQQASTAWYANSDQIAAFLASANPAWPEATLKDMMRSHLDQTLAEATAQLTGDYAQSVHEYDHIVAHILEMADALSSGIVTQFGDRFSDPDVSGSQIQLSEAMRSLWEDHVAWTRLYIVSAVADLPDADATLQRLLQNQTDIGDAVAPFYGEAAGAQLTTLLNGHIAIAGELVGAAKASDEAAVQQASTAWYANSDQIAAFLASANPAWPEATLKDMMRSHLDQTLAEATAQLTGDYAQSVHEYDHIVAHILEMADALSSGIVTQFGDRFGE